MNLYFGGFVMLVVIYLLVMLGFFFLCGMLGLILFGLGLWSRSFGDVVVVEYVWIVLEILLVVVLEGRL